MKQIMKKMKFFSNILLFFQRFISLFFRVEEKPAV